MLTTERIRSILEKVAKPLTAEQYAGHVEASTAADRAVSRPDTTRYAKVPPVAAPDGFQTLRPAYPALGQKAVQYADFTRGQGAYPQSVTTGRNNPNRKADFSSEEPDVTVGNRRHRAVDPDAPKKPQLRGNMADADFRKNLSTAQSLRGSDGQKLHGAELLDAFQKRMEARDQTAQSPKPEHRSPSGVAIENPFGGVAAATPSQPKTPPAVGHVMPPAPTDAKRAAGAALPQMTQMRPAAQAPTPAVAAPPAVRTPVRPAATPVAAPPPRPAGAGQMAQQPLVPPLTLSGRFGG